jgi:hypothetical protein
MAPPFVRSPPHSSKLAISFLGRPSIRRRFKAFTYVLVSVVAELAALSASS